MDRSIRLVGRDVRISSSSEGALEGLEAEFERALTEPAVRSAAREMLAELGLDPVQIEDAELLHKVRELLDTKQIHLRDEAPFESLWRSELLPDSTEPPQPAEPATGDDDDETDQKYRLCELVEVVDRGGIGTVGGAGKQSAKLPHHLDRTEKEGSAFKQFINLGRDIDGAANRHPENGRTVDLRARIEWTGGDKTRALSGRTVKWKLVVTKHSGTGRPAAFAVDGEKSGLGGKDDSLEATSTTNGDGLASMTLHLSQYAGDKFEVTAEVDTADADAQGGAALKAGPWVVWRKFWYQLTKPDGNAVPAPTDSVTAYTGIAADMLAADEVVFKKDDSPAPPDRTFYPRGMTKTGSAAADEIALIGGHNRDWFWAKYNAEASKPVKGHLIICDGQWDPIDVSSLQTFGVTAASQELTMDIGGAFNAGIVKPALKDTLVTSACWRIKPSMQAKYNAATPDASLPARPASFTGTLDDADFSIPLPRTALNKITVTLPAACPDPTVYEVEVVLKVAYGKFYGGESVGVNMLIKYTTGTKSAAFYQAVSHELGHGFKTVPDKKNSDSLPDHANQYDDADGHGGQGSHCKTGSSTGAVDSGAANGRYEDGTCIMFHQLSPDTCTQDVL